MVLNNMRLEKKDHVAVVTIDHPPANAWDKATTRDFEKVLDDIEADRNVRVAILTGAGEKCFSAGFDVSDTANSDYTGPKCRELWIRVDRFTKPVIAAINGFALGGGLELALCCHFRIMANAPHAMLGLTELNLGIIPGWGGTQRLPLVVGKAKALEMILFSKKISAQEAMDIGLINQMASPETLMQEALEFAGILAKRPPIAMGLVLKAISTLSYEGLEKGLEAEAEASLIVRDTKDCAEGFTAFLEKREPVFTGE